MTSILYIDSETSYSSGLIKSFKNEGFNTSFAPSYVEGLNTIHRKNFSPSVVLCAARIGNTECIEFLRQTREDRFLKKIPIIVLSDQENREHTLRVLIAGAADVINRSCELNYLMAKLYAQSKTFTNRRKSSSLQKASSSSERALLIRIQSELNAISKKITLGETSYSEFNSVTDKFSQYLSKKLA